MRALPRVQAHVLDAGHKLRKTHADRAIVGVAAHHRQVVLRALAHSTLRDNGANNGGSNQPAA